MDISRRTFVSTTAAGLCIPRAMAARPLAPAPATAPDRFDPWLEIDPDALRHNVAHITRLTRGRPILAVVKNNAYGLGLTAVASVLEPLSAIAGFAVVKAEAAVSLRDAGVRKPVLLMGMASDGEARELAARRVMLSLYTERAADRVGRLAAAFARPVDAHLYLDTGMGRMGMPYHQAMSWLGALAHRDDLRIHGTFMAFTEETTFDREQLRRFTELAARARTQGANLGPLHAASSNAVFHLPDAHLDMVRPGIAIYGAYPSEPEVERALAELRPAVRLRARVVRMVRLRPGDSVSYGRNYVADKPTWVATLPVGHTDGFSRRAVDGAEVLIGDRVFPAIGAVSASHTIVEIGDEPLVKVGDVATLVGPDHPAIHPNHLAARTGTSVYDVLMHLNPGLPRSLE